MWAFLFTAVWNVFLIALCWQEWTSTNFEQLVAAHTAVWNKNRMIRPPAYFSLENKELVFISVTSVYVAKGISARFILPSLVIVLIKDNVLLLLRALILWEKKKLWKNKILESSRFHWISFVLYNRWPAFHPHFWSINTNMNIRNTFTYDHLALLFLVKTSKIKVNIFCAFKRWVKAINTKWRHLRYFYTKLLMAEKAKC